MSAASSDTLRTPPHSIDAEQAVLGGLMIASDALTHVSDILTENDFYRKDHRLVWRAITELSQRQGFSCDAITLGDWFDQNGMSDMLSNGYLAEMASNTPSAANIKAYANIVAEKSRLRQVIDQGTKIVEQAWAARESSTVIVSDASYVFSQMQTHAAVGGLEPAKVYLREMFAESLRRVERYKAGHRFIGAPTPWIDLSTLLSGWQDSTLYVVAARPSMGKTIFGLQAALHSGVELAERTAFFSIEMSGAQIMGRACACLGDIPHNFVKMPHDDHENADIHWGRLNIAVSRISESNLLIDQTPVLSARQMVARARRAHRQKPLRMIVVDHMHDMEVDANNARFDYGVITQWAKTLAKEFNCPVILLAQLNRSNTTRQDKRPVMSDIRESGEIEQKADVILFLHREEYYNPQTQDKGIVEVIPVKGRDIELGKPVRLVNRFAYMRMENYSDAYLDMIQRETPQIVIKKNAGPDPDWLN